MRLLITILTPVLITFIASGQQRTIEGRQINVDDSASISGWSVVEPETTWNEGRICDQIQKAKLHLNSQSETKSFRIKPEELIRYGWGYNFMNSEYVAGKLKVEKDEIGNQDKEKVNILFEHLGKIDNQVGKTTFELTACPQLIVKRKNPNTIISKFDDDTILFHLTTRRRGKRGPSGFIYLFFFDKDNRIDKVFKSTWIE